MADLPNIVMQNHFVKWYHCIEFISTHMKRTTNKYFGNIFWKQLMNFFPVNEDI